MQAELAELFGGMEVTRELASWEIAIDGRLERPGSPLDVAIAALAIGLSISGVTPRYRERAPRPVKPDEPTDKRIRKMQRAARKARRRGEA